MQRHFVSTLEVRPWRQPTLPMVTENNSQTNSSTAVPFRIYSSRTYNCANNNSTRIRNYNSLTSTRMRNNNSLTSQCFGSRFTTGLELAAVGFFKQFKSFYNNIFRVFYIRLGESSGKQCYSLLEWRLTLCCRLRNKMSYMCLGFTHRVLRYTSYIEK